MPQNMLQAGEPIADALGRAGIPGGLDVSYRKLWEPERPALRAHLLRLNEVDRRLRFFRGASDEAIHYYCEKINWTGATIIGCFIDGELRGVVELIFNRDRFPRQGEVALSVERPYQATGIGSVLMRMALTAARNRYVSRVYMICLQENRRMQRLARRFDAELDVQEGEVEGRIRHPWPSYFSLMEEAASDGRAFMRATFGVR
ncbi:MAG: GNAT family N-acetyltransferase [Rhodospirillaceae bacterium]|nr:GNAT family N-acetyltransferase [Rhodospirillaceae bacterium]